MPDVTVSADDVAVVAAAMLEVSAKFGWVTVLVPGFGAALAAVARMTSVPAGQMPDDPVAGPDTAAIGHHEMMCAYERNGFAHEEAFAILMAYVTASATGFALRGGPHG